MFWLPKCCFASIQTSVNLCLAVLWHNVLNDKDFKRKICFFKNKNNKISVEKDTIISHQTKLKFLRIFC